MPQLMYRIATGRSPIRGRTTRRSRRPAPASSPGRWRRPRPIATSRRPRCSPTCRRSPPRCRGRSPIALPSESGNGCGGIGRLRPPLLGAASGSTPERRSRWAWRPVSSLAESCALGLSAWRRGLAAVGAATARTPRSPPPRPANRSRSASFTHSAARWRPARRLVVDATLFAIDEVNQAGGVLGRPIKPVVADGQSDWPTFAREAERLITRGEGLHDLRLLGLGRPQDGQDRSSRPTTTC